MPKPRAQFSLPGGGSCDVLKHSQVPLNFLVSAKTSQNAFYLLRIETTIKSSLSGKELLQCWKFILIRGTFHFESQFRGSLQIFSTRVPRTLIFAPPNDIVPLTSLYS
ncbi:hypothetical protein VNO77_44569 [Canavalia gladiata]|uniref:Uncharacterized protein n=1 Tax=Canavalia gladiata TaxID=3824 RepID=A0AAN9PR57_CANGL